MIQPTRKLLGILVVGLAVSLLPAIVSTALWPVWGVMLAVTVGGVLFDLVGIPGAHALNLQVAAPETLGIGTRGVLVMDLSARSSRARELEVDLLVDLHADLASQPIVRRALKDGALHTEVPLIAHQRGKVAVHAVWMRWTGPLRLVTRSVRVAVDLAIEVVPDLAGVRDAAIRWFRHHDLSSGQKTLNLPGDGSEFDALREFQQGHDPRAIDWNASARMRRLLVREFRAERNHDIVIGLDCGQLMREPVEGVPRLDHAINAGLLLSYACLKTGDRIGMFAFDSAVRSWITPTAGMGTVTRLQKECSRLEYHAVETNFTSGLTELSARLRRRTLVVLFTEFWDAVTAELMVENVGRLGRRHLVLFVILRDPLLENLADAPLVEHDDLERAVVAQGLLHEREAVLQKLRNLGVRIVHSSTETAAGDLVSHYLRIHQRELL